MIDPVTGEYVRTFSTHRAVWHGIELEIRHDGNFLGMGRDHVEVESIQPARAPLPITETGYRSAFPAHGAVEAAGGPVALVLAWLDEAAKDRKWQRERQLSLF